MKQTIIAIIFFLYTTFSNSAVAQFKVYEDGSAQVNSTTPAWGSAMLTNVYNGSACAYNLNYNNQAQFFVCAQGWLWTRTGGYFGSDINLKKNVEPIESPMGIITKLDGVSYQFKDEVINVPEGDKNPIRYGLIAQEVEKVLPDLVKTMPDKTKSVAYLDLIGILIEGIKEQQQEITLLKEEVNKIKENEATTINNIPVEANIKTSKLFQNEPNPFTLQTEIAYYIPENINDASILLFDMQGTLIKTFDLEQKGNGTIMINGSELNAGMFIYSLIVDGKEVDTKRMILTQSYWVNPQN